MSTAFILPDPLGGPPIPFREAIPDSPSEQIASDASRVERNYLVTWPRRRAAECALLGVVRHLVDPVGNPYLSRTLPHADLERGWLRARSISRMVGVSARRQTVTERGGAAGYEDARLTVAYELLDYAVVDDGLVTGAFGLPDEALLRRWVVREADLTSQTFLMRGGAFKWFGAAGGPGDPPVPPPVPSSPVLEGTPIQLRSAELVYTAIAWPETAIPWLASGVVLDRKTNNALFDGRFDANTLTLTMWKPQKRYAMPDGTIVRNILMKMKYRPGGVNFFPRPGAPRNQLFWQVSSTGDATGVGPYEPIDFNALFRPGT